MSRSIYDDWEKLVSAVRRREELRELCYAPSMSSHSSDISFPSPLPDFIPSFEASQAVLRPTEIYVNNKRLDRWELIALQSCPNPPRELKHGRYYWYDKLTGFWGKVNMIKRLIIFCGYSLCELSVGLYFMLPGLSFGCFS